jgi:hypothetical protein
MLLMTAAETLQHELGQGVQRSYTFSSKHLQGQFVTTQAKVVEMACLYQIRFRYQRR